MNIKKYFYSDFLRFIIIGGIATLIDFCIYISLSHFLHVLVAKSISMSISGGFSFILNKNWTFKYFENDKAKTFFKYFAVFFINIAFNSFINFLFFKITSNKVLSFIIATCSAMILNFSLQKIFVFSKNSFSNYFLKENQKKAFEFFCLLYILSAFTVLPPLYNLKTIINHTITTNLIDHSENSNIRMIPGTTVEQDLYFQGTVKNLRLFVDNSKNPSPSVLSVSIVQGDIALSKNITIPSNVADFRNIDINWKQLGIGNGKLIIKNEISDGTTPENCPRLYVSNDIASGLPGCVWNARLCAAPLFLEYTVNLFPEWFALDIILLTLLFMTLAIVSFCFAYKPRIAIKYKAALLPAATFATVFLALSARSPITSFLGEPKSEAAYDFWYSQVYNGFAKSLFRFEAGLYLSWLQRIVTFVSTVLFPTQFIFAGMQVITTAIISTVASLFCVKELQKRHSAFGLYVFSVFAATLFSFTPTQYWFHGLGYWGIYFIFWMMIRNPDNFSWPEFIICELLTIILCFSKLFIVAWIPVALFHIIVLRKGCSKKQIIFYLSLALFALIHIVYVFTFTHSVISERQAVGSFKIPAPSRLFANLLYYEIQALEKFFTPTVAFKNPLSANIIFGFLLLLFISGAVFLSFSKSRRYKNIGILQLKCWVLSFSSVGICILAGLSGVDMRRPISWSQSVWPNSVHWFYVSVPLLFIFASSLHLLYEELKEKNAHVSAKWIVSIIAIIIGLNYLPNSKAFGNLDEYQVEWRKIWRQTKNEAYHVPINAELPGAEKISLFHNSFSKVYGFGNDGYWNELDNGIGAKRDVVYSEASIASIGSEEILNITAQRANRNFRTNYTMLLLDASGNILRSVRQATSDDREWMTFILDEPCRGAASVKFVYTDSPLSPAWVKGVLNVGYIAWGVHS